MYLHGRTSGLLSTGGIDDEIAAEVPFAIHPNPTSGLFTIELPTEQAEITVTNVLGEIVLQQNATNSTMNLQLDRSGSYLVRLITEQGITTRKLVVDR